MDTIKIPVYFQGNTVYETSIHSSDTDSLIWLPCVQLIIFKGNTPKSRMILDICGYNPLKCREIEPKNESSLGQAHRWVFQFKMNYSSVIEYRNKMLD